MSGTEQLKDAHAEIERLEKENERLRQMNETAAKEIKILEGLVANECELRCPVPKPSDSEIIEDGHGSAWSARCSDCGDLSMEVVRPGKVQCNNCG